MKRKFKAVKRAPTPGEEGQFKNREVDLRGKRHVLDVSEKMGSDGVIETHVNYKAAPKAYYGKPKSVMCGSCMTWVMKDYKPYPHKKGCKTQ